MKRDALPLSRGFTVFEIVIAMLLLGAVIAFIVPVTKRAIDQRRRSDDRRAALLEVSNALERVVTEAGFRTEPEPEREVPVPADLARRFREPRLTVSSVALAGQPAGRRFDAAFTWVAESGSPASPIRLSAFTFAAAPGEESP
jgi:type II secretory pathway pseudopilin PulG